MASLQDAHMRWPGGTYTYAQQDAKGETDDKRTPEVPVPARCKHG